MIAQLHIGTRLYTPDTMHRHQRKLRKKKKKRLRLPFGMSMASGDETGERRRRGLVMRAAKAEEPEPVAQREEITHKETSDDSFVEVLARLHESAIDMEKDLLAQSEMLDRLDKSSDGVPKTDALSSKDKGLCTT